jgi:hypothetical protein
VDREEAMRNRRVPISLAAGLALGLLAAPSPAATIGCREWLRLDDPGKMATIDGMIADLLGSRGKVRQYDVHRGAIARCLGENAVQMSYEFDDVCSDSRSADMQAIQRVFKNYVWSCN